MAAPIYYDASRVRPEVFAMAARQSRVTLAEYQDLRLNGHERLLLYRHLDDEALAWALELCATGYGAPFGLHRVPTTHPDLGLCVLAPILTARLRERHAAAAQLPPGALSAEDLVKACANVGVDLTCGACASVFYTGAAPGTPHDDGCKSARSSAMPAEDLTKATDELAAATQLLGVSTPRRTLIEVFDEAKAQREPPTARQAPDADGFITCEFCACHTNAKMRACCDAGRARDREHAKRWRALPTDRELLEAWFRAKPNPRFEDVPLWVLVKEAFQVGATWANAICRQFEQDPDQKVPGHGDEDGVCGACGSWHCPNCENLSYVPEGSAPKCNHCEEESEEEDHGTRQQGAT